MLNISPILAQKLNNNSTNNTTVDNYAQVQTKPMPNDKFEKSNKSKKGLIVAGSIGASLVAFGGFVMLAKKGKLGEGCKEFVDKIFKSNKSKVQSNVPDATKIAQEAQERATREASERFNNFISRNDLTLDEVQKFNRDNLNEVQIKQLDDLVAQLTKKQEVIPEIIPNVTEEAVDTIQDNLVKHQEEFSALMSKENVTLEELQGFDRSNLTQEQIAELDGKIKAKLDTVKPEIEKADIVPELAPRQADGIIEESQNGLGKQISHAPDYEYSYSLTDKQGDDTATYCFEHMGKKYTITLDKNVVSGGDASRKYIRNYSYPYGDTLKRIQLEGEDAFAKRIEKEWWRPDDIIDSMSPIQDISAAKLYLEDKGMTQEQIKTLLSTESENTMLDIFQDAKTYAQYQIKAAYDSIERMQKEISERFKAQPQASVLYRAMDLSDSSELSKALKSSLSKGDKTILQYNPMYTTPDFRYMLEYKNSDILKINVPAGAHVAYGGETLLPGMSQFEFVRRDTIGDINFYELNYIPFEAKQ